MKKVFGSKKGFTLIELIIVIVILGILGAIAMPKFANLSKDAKEASVEGMAGAIKAASAVVHGKWLLDTTLTSVTLEGVPVTLATGGNTVGYPSEAAGGIDKAVDYGDKYTFDAGTDISDTAADNATFGFGLQSANCYAWYGVKDNGSYAGTVKTGCE